MRERERSKLLSLELEEAERCVISGQTDSDMEEEEAEEAEGYGVEFNNDHC